MQAIRKSVASQHLDAIAARQLIGIEPQLVSQAFVQFDEARCRNRPRISAGEEALRQLGIAVLQARGLQRGLACRTGRDRRHCKITIRH
jgi:hypothetical protein